MKKTLIFSWSLSFLFFLAACDLNQEIELDLPAYESQLVVECYLEPGQPFKALITRSAGYFDPFPTLDDRFLENILENEARVSISINEVVYDLQNELFFNISSGKLFNYSTPPSVNVPANYEDEFRLEIVTKDGQEITATTKILPVIPIDSLVVQFNSNDTLARVLTYLTDIPDASNFYRRTVHETSLDSSAVQDFTTDDRIIEDVIVFGTGYDYEVGTEVIHTIYHIDQSYYDFLESLARATSANFNPFAQPSPIISNLESTEDVIGIFTGLSYDRVTVTIEE